ncbi:ZIP family metal transporter [Longibacter salinarum]|uniref:ZIP family metal transporter n=1 Tax=Longibacter salinarum TaxID=1850348 RepID=A0A2A8D206_9BACT|nr:ZIP family metal transporter [Longibacter salinarum]PEN15002.1 ZIP family metal transporter [Longibacter salinarum]
MIEGASAWFAVQSPMLQALLAGLFTWTVTALGASVVFFTESVNRRFLDAMMGFAAGVMIAASFWSLLAPSIDMAEAQGIPTWLPATVGFLLGGVFLRLADAILPHLHVGAEMHEAEGMQTSWRRATLLVLAITLHNIPEGLAVGVTFGAAALQMDVATGATLAAAVALAIGIGLQNFPEGIAVSMPLRGEGVTPLKSFWYGQMSGFVEPVSAVLGAFAVVSVRPLLPYALSFAAGAMIFVVVEELIPESQRHGNTDLATMGAMGGFAVMMLLDVALG